MGKIRVGVIGCGRIGKLHISNLKLLVPDAELVMVADPFFTAEGEALCKNLGITNLTKNVDDIFNCKDIDAVFICSATATHADYIIRSAEAGKDVFCEKPIDIDLEKIKKALDAVKKAGVKLQIGFVRRFDHNHKTVHDTVASGILGKPHIVKVSSRDPENAPLEYLKVSGGIHIDMTIHDFDMARYLSGSEITEVMAYGATKITPELKEYGDVDTTIIMLKFENGAIGVIDNSRAAHYGYDQRSEVHCDKGCVQTGNDRENQAMISTADGVQIAKPTWFNFERYNDAFVAEAVAFINACQGKGEIPVSGHDGLMAVVVAKAAKKSLEENRPVKTNEILG